MLSNRNQQRMRNIEDRYKSGIIYLKHKGFYHLIVDEVYYLIKYLHPQMFVRLLSENLLNDIRGVFSVFVREDLKKVYEDLQSNHNDSTEVYLKKEYVNLVVLYKCATSLEYQVRSIARMPEVKNFRLKSRLLESISKRLNGEIQDYYRILEKNYKKFFRLKFSKNPSKNSTVSLQCIDNLSKDYNEHFVEIIEHFQQLAMAIHFVKDLLKAGIEHKIVNQLAPIFDQQEKYNKIVDYFINDLKRNFIQFMMAQLKNGKSLVWIQKGLEEFIQSERFGTMLRKVIFQTLSLMRKKKSYRNVS